MTRWITADTHFGHANIIAYCGRPFASVEEHDETLVRRWNARVGKCDEVIHLGDFALTRRDRMAGLAARLHGRKYLVLGNHDRGAGTMHEVGFNVLPMGVEVDGYALVHDPEDVPGRSGRAFCGHVHEKWKVRTVGGVVVMNVGVDQWGFAPVEWNEAKMRCLIDGVKEVRDGATNEV